MTATALVDIHSHVLPGLDDGARDLEEALAMLRVAAADGIEIIAATPHAADVNVEQVRAGVASLNRQAAEAGLEITVVTGSEVRLSADLADRYREGEIVPLNGTGYVLVELPSRRQWPQLLETTVYTMQMAGITPILAHAERYLAVQQDPAVLLPLVNMGVFVQVNAAALSDSGENDEQQAAVSLLTCRMVHVIASDAHNVQNSPPRLSDAFSRAATLVEDEYLTWIRDAASQIVQGGVPPLPEPDTAGLGRRRWLRKARRLIQR